MEDINILNSKILSQLPNVLVNMILEYLNVISYRNGKYINRINDIDIRYDLLKKIPRPIKISDNQYYIGLREKGRQVIKMSLTYIIYIDGVSIITSENNIGKNGLIYKKNRKNDVFIR